VGSGLAVRHEPAGRPIGSRRKSKSTPCGAWVTWNPDDPQRRRTWNPKTARVVRDYAESRPLVTSR